MLVCHICRAAGKREEATHACIPTISPHSTTYFCAAHAAVHNSTCNLIQKGRAVLISLEKQKAQGPAPEAGREESEEPLVGETSPGDPGVEPPAPLPETAEE